MDFEQAATQAEEMPLQRPDARQAAARKRASRESASQGIRQEVAHREEGRRSQDNDRAVQRRPRQGVARGHEGAEGLRRECQDEESFRAGSGSCNRPEQHNDNQAQPGRQEKKEVHNQERQEAGKRNWRKGKGKIISETEG